MNVTEQQVLALAPDAASANNGKKLASASYWSGLGQSPRALWGECKGSGSKPYLVRIDLGDFASKCSCPSFKFPCKHALGLLLLTVRQPALITVQGEADWVAEWLDKRLQSQAGKEARAQAKAAAPVDEKAQQKRSDKRDNRVADGLAAFQLWLEDAVRNGLARLPAEGMGVWEQQAARLVDAQLGGLAARLVPLGERVGAQEDWPQRVVSGLGRLALAVRAYQQLAQLPAALQADVRQLLGFNLREEEVLAAAILQRDQWQVIGQHVEDGERVRVQRSWVLGATSGQYGLLLQFAVGNQPFAASGLPGTAFEAELAFWPGGLALRALSKTSPLPLPAPGHFSHADSIDALLTRSSEWLAVNPWLERIPAVIADAVPVPGEQGWSVVDATGHALPLRGQDHWLWLAVTGGTAQAVAVEWNGEEILPLGVWVEQRYYRLTGVLPG